MTLAAVLYRAIAADWCDPNAGKPFSNGETDRGAMSRGTPSFPRSEYPRALPVPSPAIVVSAGRDARTP
ncbi:hypothetical protein GCM10010501_27780 [Streptomyces libani subsp. rufus]|nr:hypothetical protein GCM10010501_27780 [Streptomyces libani subsp. rufus]